MTSSPIRARLAACTAGLLAALAVTAGGASAQGTPLPAHVFAPYFETWTSDSLTTVAQASGARYFTMAFIEAPSPDLCQPAWDGEPDRGMSSGAYVDDLASLRALGGDIVPSFGGYSADHGGTDIAETCKGAEQLAAAYE